MALSRKYYVVVAHVLKDNAEFNVSVDKPDAVTAIANIADEFADLFEKDNAAFDRERFLKAATPQ